jgi:uncharacterized membrane protein YphA (DoxX/SURF4 family)
MSRERWTQGLSVTLAAVYGFAGIAKLLGMEFVLERFESWGYPVVFAQLIGMLELCGAIGLLVPRVASVAAIGLMLVMFGATYTHIFRGSPLLAIVPLACIAALGVIAQRRLNVPERGLIKAPR